MAMKSSSVHAPEAEKITKTKWAQFLQAVTPMAGGAVISFLVMATYV